MLINRNPEYFLAVARERSFSRAAERLYISQPSLSQHISKLEQTLETRLFDRSQSPLTLTPAGEAYARFLESNGYLYQKFLTELTEVSARRSTTVNLALGTWRGSILFPAILPAFLREYPHAHVNLHEYPISELPALVQDGRADFAVMNTSPAGLPETLVSETIAYERILLVLNRSHPTAEAFARNQKNGQPHHLQLLCEECFISLDKRLTVGRQVSNFLERNLLSFPRRLTTTNNSTALKLVAAGMGFCFLVESGLQDASFHPELAFFDLQSPDLELPLSVCYKVGGYLPPLSRALMDMIRVHYQEVIKRQMAQPLE